MSWFVADELPRLWSRCIDAYAEEGDLENGKRLVVYAVKHRIHLKLEPAAAKKLRDDYVNELREARRQAIEEREAQDVPFDHQEETRAALKEKIGKGRDGGAYHPPQVFSPYWKHSRYMKVIGEPDRQSKFGSDESWTYRCANGSITFKVVVAGGSIVSFKGIARESR